MINPFRGIRVVLFDLDGTLIETHIDFPAMKRAAIRHAESRGVPARCWEGLDILTIVERSVAALGKTAGTEAARQYRLDAFAMLEAIEVEQCGNPVEVDGAAELLRRLRGNGVKIGIVTRNCRTVAEGLTARWDLVHDCLLTRDDVPRTKPDPAHLTAALDLLGDPAGRRAGTEARRERHGVIIGDHWMDVQGGRAAGLGTVGILLGRPSSFYDPWPPDLLVDRLADLLDFVDAAGTAVER